MYEWSLVAECDAVLEICDDNRVSGKKKNNNNNNNNKDSTERAVPASVDTGTKITN